MTEDIPFMSHCSNGRRERWEGFSEECYVQLKGRCTGALVHRGRPQIAGVCFTIGIEARASDCFFHKELVFEEIDTANLFLKMHNICICQASSRTSFNIYILCIGKYIFKI